MAEVEKHLCDAGARRIVRKQQDLVLEAGALARLIVEHGAREVVVGRDPAEEDGLGDDIDARVHDGGRRHLEGESGKAFGLCHEGALLCDVELLLAAGVVDAADAKPAS